MKIASLILVLVLVVSAVFADPAPHKYKKGGFGRRRGGFGYAPVKVIPVHYPVFVGKGYGGGYGGGFGGGFGPGFGGGFGGGYGGLYGGHYGGRYGYGR
nr:protein suex-1-like [Cherax quadricarinatus]